MTQIRHPGAPKYTPPPEKNWKVPALTRSEAMRQNMERVAAFRAPPSLIGKESER